MAELKFYDIKSDRTIQLGKEQAAWLVNILSKINPENTEIYTFRKVKEDFESRLGQDFEPFWYSKTISTLRERGLLVL